MADASGRVHPPIMRGVHGGDWDRSGGRINPWRLGTGLGLANVMVVSPGNDC